MVVLTQFMIEPTQGDYSNGTLESNILSFVNRLQRAVLAFQLGVRMSI